MAVKDSELRDKLESVYRCTISIRTKATAYGLHMDVTFWHLPHALEGLGTGDLAAAVLANLKGKIKLAPGKKEITFSYNVRKMP